MSTNAQFDKAVELVGPLLRRMDRVNRKMLIPALADGQAGLVIDTKLTSEQFAKSLPGTDEPMPMFEPALLIGVSDAKLLRQACAEYRDILDSLLDGVRKIDPDAIPEECVVPNPAVTESEVGTIFSYALPEEWGVDEKIAPNFGLSETVAVLSISQDHTRRLLASTPLKAGGVLEDSERPLAMASVVDCAGLIDAITPWVNMAVKKASENSADDGGGFNPMAGLGMQVQTVLEVLKVFRTVTSEVYFEDDSLVTHSLMELRDVAE